MGLFTKQPMQLKQNLPYTVSVSSKTKLIVGLGNPGKEYENTRHNIGFMAIDKFASDNEFSPWQESSKFLGFISEKRIRDVRVILIKPSTYMNLSGQSAAALVNFFKIDLKDVSAVYDDLSIPFGQIRTRLGGQSAGHNGVKSLIEHIGPNFCRIKIGIKNDKTVSSDQSKFVLAKFPKSELENIDLIVKETGSILTEFIYGETIQQDTRNILI